VKPLAARDRQANSIAPAFDFNQTPREPAFVAAERGTPPEKQPVRAVVYVAYALALFLAAGSIAAAFVTERRRRRRGELEPSIEPEEKPRPKVTA
jgi:hypothetical protein